MEPQNADQSGFGGVEGKVVRGLCCEQEAGLWVSEDRGEPQSG